MWKNGVKFFFKFCENYWETCCSIFDLLKSNIMKALTILFTVISSLFIGAFYSAEIVTKILNFEYKYLLWLITILFVPFFIMPFTLTVKTVRLEKELNNRQKKNALTDQLKEKFVTLQHEELSRNPKMNYNDFVRECAAIMRDSGVLSEADVYRYETKAITAICEKREELLFNIIEKLSYY